MEYLNKGGLFVSTLKHTEKSPDYFGTIKVDRNYLKFLMEQHEEDAIEIKLSGWKSIAKTTGKPYVSLAVDTYVKKEEATPPSTKDEWEI